MSNINSIFSSTLFLVIVFLVFSISFVGFTKYQEISYSLDFNNMNYHIIESKFKTFLFSYDFYSNDINLNNFYYGFIHNKSYNSIYGNINLTSSIEKKLDLFYGKNNYYLKSNLDISGISVNILYDDGSFMKKLSKDNNFKLHIEDLNSEIISNYGDFIKLNVYLLSNNNSICDYDPNSEIGCFVIDPGSLYIPMTSYDPNFNDPYLSEYPDYETNISLLSNLYSKNDWATFISRVSDLNSQKGSLSNLNLIMFFTDVINLGGIDDSYYLQNYAYDYSRCYKLNEQAISDPSDCDNYNCDLCVKLVQNSTVARYNYNYYCIENDDFVVSNKSVIRSIDLLKNNKDIVFPIYVKDLNFLEDPSIYDYMSHSTYSYITSSPELNGGDPNTICGKQSCIGCDENSSYDITFHPETIETHLNQLSWIAGNTTGQIIDFNLNLNLFNVINNTIAQTFDRYEMSFGIKQENILQKLKFESIYTINGESVPIIFDLEVYDNPYNFSGDLNFKPIVNDHYIDNSDFYIILSHNSEIISSSFSTNSADIFLLDSNQDDFYKYKLKFNNYIPNLNLEKLIYVDDYGSYDLTIY